MESKNFYQLKTDVIGVEIEFERVERKVDGLQNDVSALRRDFKAFRNENRAEFRAVKEDVQTLRAEM